jgi:hypothetical protein
MSDRDKDPGETLSPNEFEPGEDEFEENPEEGFEDEGEPEESDEDEGRPPVAAPSGRRFGLGRGGQRAEDSGHRVTGSVRESHERVHIDDRASAIYALFAAAVLLGVLALALAGNYIPQATVATNPPLPSLPTFNGTLPPSAGPSVSIAPSTSPVASPTPTPTPAPSTSQVASPSAT